MNYQKQHVWKETSSEIQLNTFYQSRREYERDMNVISYNILLQCLCCTKEAKFTGWISYITIDSNLHVNTNPTVKKEKHIIDYLRITSLNINLEESFSGYSNKVRKILMPTAACSNNISAYWNMKLYFAFKILQITK